MAISGAFLFRAGAAKASKVSFGPWSCAVEMARHGKRGKLKKQVSPSFHRAWKSGQRRRIPTFPHSHSAGDGCHTDTTSKLLPLEGGRRSGRSQRTNGRALNASSWHPLAGCSQTRQIDLTCLNFCLLMLSLGMIWHTVLNAGIGTAWDCGTSLNSGGMTRGSERGVNGTAGLAAPIRIAWPATVRKLCQNPIDFAKKRSNFERKQNPRKRVSAWEGKG